MNDYLHDAWKYYEYGRAYNSFPVPNQYNEREQPVFDVNRLFDPYGYASSGG